MRKTALISTFAGLGLIGMSVVPAFAQFNNQTIPENCLSDGRLLLTGANYQECAQYGRVDAPESSTNATQPAGGAAGSGTNQ